MNGIDIRAASPTPTISPMVPATIIEKGMPLNLSNNILKGRRVIYGPKLAPNIHPAREITGLQGR
jgi:hypothetical protein